MTSREEFTPAGATETKQTENAKEGDAGVEEQQQRSRNQKQHRKRPTAGLLYALQGDVPLQAILALDPQQIHNHQNVRTSSDLFST